MSNIVFEEKAHTYTRLGIRYTSVTQMIGKYEPPFETEYWSLYKAIKEVFDRKGLWARYKKHVGGWKNVVAYYMANGSNHAAEVLVVQNRFKAEWIAKNQRAIQKGSNTHKILEDAINTRKKVVFDNHKLPPNYIKYIPLNNHDSHEIFTEPFLWSDDYQIAGQSDLIIKLGRRLRIKDYKTNEEITTEAFDNQTFLHPLEHLPLHKYNIYCLQLSTYGYMLERWGFVVEDLELLHILPDRVEPIKCHYLKEEVKEMLAHHKANY